MSANNTPNKKVSFFSHFPHLFLKPYSKQPNVTNNDFLGKLTSTNCEWLLRPQIGCSEFAEAIVDNADTIADSNLFTQALQ